MESATGGLFWVLAIDNEDRVQLLHITGGAITPPYRLDLVEAQLRRPDKPKSILAVEEKMDYLGNFQMKRGYSNQMVYMYRRRNGAIQFLCSSAMWCKQFPDWEAAKKEIPHNAEVNLTDKRMAS